jgi:hypothetical protein
MEEKNGRYSIKIGNQLILGEKKALPKPRLIMRKVKTEEGGLVLRVEAMIKERICFFTRPKPVKS